MDLTLDKDCIRTWSKDKPQATHHPNEVCCHTSAFSRTPPAIRGPLIPPVLSDGSNLICGASPHVIRTLMDQLNCTCLQETLAGKPPDHIHEYMHGNGSEILVGSLWQLPPHLGISNIYPPVLPISSNSILGRETLYAGGDMAIIHFYKPECLLGILISVLLCALVTATSKVLLQQTYVAPQRDVLKTGSEPDHLIRFIFNYLYDLFDAVLMYVGEHLHQATTIFPGLQFAIEDFMFQDWLHFAWLLGSFWLYTIASNDLISLLISPLHSTRYHSLEEIESRGQEDLVVYYWPQSTLDLLVRSGGIFLYNPFRIDRGRYFRAHADRVFDTEMRHERSIIVSDMDNLQMVQNWHLEEFNFPTYLHLDTKEDAFFWLFTTTRLPAHVEKLFRYM